MFIFAKLNPRKLFIKLNLNSRWLFKFYENYINFLKNPHEGKFEKYWTVSEENEQITCIDKLLMVLNKGTFYKWHAILKGREEHSLLGSTQHQPISDQKANSQIAALHFLKYLILFHIDILIQRFYHQFSIFEIFKSSQGN